MDGNYTQMSFSLQKRTAMYGIFSRIISNISSVISSISSDFVCCSNHFNNDSSSSSRPSYTVGMPFSKYNNAGIDSIPYSFASSMLSILTNVMPSESHSSSIFSSSSRTFCDLSSLLSSKISRIRRKYFNYYSIFF